MSGDLVYKTTTQPVEFTQPAENPTSWWEWTDERISRELAAVTESVGGIFCEEREHHRREIEKATEPLKREIAELRAQVDTLIRLSGAKSSSDLKSAIAGLKVPGPAGPAGPRGPKGARGERGMAAPTIIGWAIDRERFAVLPLLSSGRPGPAIELRDLFKLYQAQTSSEPIAGQ
jgi:hypothetical protein